MYDTVACAGKEAEARPAPGKMDVGYAAKLARRGLPEQTNRLFASKARQQPRCKVGIEERCLLPTSTLKKISKILSILPSNIFLDITDIVWCILNTDARFLWRRDRVLLWYSTF